MAGAWPSAVTAGGCDGGNGWPSAWVAGVAGNGGNTDGGTGDGGPAAGVGGACAGGGTGDEPPAGGPDTDGENARSTEVREASAGDPYAGAAETGGWVGAPDADEP
jgi:hypothetical protein